MSKKVFFLRLLSVISFVYMLIPFSSLKAENVFFTITANSGTANPIPNQGNFSQSTITVNSGDFVTITFNIPSNDPYCCGAQIKGNGGQFDAGVITKGNSKSVNFTAGSSFNFTSYWPNGLVKATGQVIVNQPQPQPPSAPSGLNATSISTSQINLTWNAGNGATSYDIYRNDAYLNNVSTLFYNDSGLNPSTTYTYKIKSKGSGLESDFSNSASATTKTPAPAQNNTGGNNQQGSNNTNQNTNTGTSSNQTNNNQQTQNSTQQNTTPGTVDYEVFDESDESIYIDPVQNLVYVNDIAYTYENIPEIKQGDLFKIYGRTEAFADVKITVNSTPQEYTTKADSSGFWNIAVDTSELEGGEHSYIVEINSADTPAKYTSNPVTFSVEGTQSFTANPEDMNILMIIGGGIVLILILLLAIYIYLKRGDAGYNKNVYTPPPAPLPAAFQKEISNIKATQQHTVAPEQLQPVLPQSAPVVPEPVIPVTQVPQVPADPSVIVPTPIAEQAPVQQSVQPSFPTPEIPAQPQPIKPA